MTDLGDELNQAATTSTTIQVPKEWQPYSEQVGQIGRAIVHIPRPGATHRDLLITAGFDPDEWQIDGDVKVRKWMGYDHRWLYWYGFAVKAGESPEAVQTHVDELTKVIRSQRHRSPAGVASGTDAWAFVATDWQIGKAEGGDGTDQTVDRVLESLDMAYQRVKDLRRIGRRMPVGALLGLGDIVEGCTGFYPSQEFLVDRTRREQGRITRELLTHAIDTLSPLFDEFHVASVAGNHGENRKDGKAFTNTGDNDDVAAFEAVREAFSRAGSAVRWTIPDEELSVALELGGVKVGMTHGHLARRGATPQAKQDDWWRRQDFGYQALRDTQILLTGHYHHFSAVTYGRRTAIQAPAMDPGSAWWRMATGEAAPAGVVTLRFDATEPLGWADLQVLSPTRTT